MHLYLSQRSVNWGNTRAACLRLHPLGVADFNHQGPGHPEPYAECAACQRRLPIVLMDIDHIRDRAGYTSNIFDTTNIRFYDALNGANITDNFVCESLGHSVSVYLRIVQAPRIDGRPSRAGAGENMVRGDRAVTIDANTAYENDLANLQWLCGLCNSSKNNADWNTWIGAAYPGRAAQPFR